MRVGLLTYHFSDNFGALLQAYALRSWLQEQGHTAEFINYHPSYVEEGGRFNLAKPFSKKNIKSIYLKLVKIRERFSGNQKYHGGLAQFRTECLGVKGQRLRNKVDIESSMCSYDLLLCGSDQIWRPSDQYGVDDVYFLNFKLSNSPRKASYAASFGTDTLADECKAQVAQYINALDSVSLRERSGARIVKSICDLEVECVPDPTFLLDDYSELILEKNSSQKGHIFCYYLRSREVIGDVALKIAEKFSTNILSPHNPHRRWREIGETVYPGPKEWLELLASSIFVVTNSFHGTALSVLLRKEFVVVGLQGNKKPFNARVKNLLAELGLESRFIEDASDSSVAKILANPIDWSTVEEKVKKIRASGRAYLLAQLDETLATE